MIITSQERDYWIKIENLKQYLTNIPRYHPDDPRYLIYWKGQKKVLIEGMWGQESNGYRYCPGVLYGYGNFYTIKETDHEKKSRFNMRPSIRDLEWHRAYNFLEAQGFSGFSEDNEHSCDEALLDEKILNFVKERKPKRYARLLNDNGDLKTYVAAREYLKKLHDKPLGIPLYNNYTKNIMELGSRGGGKSYWASWLAVFLIITDSMKVYDITGEIPAASVCIGSSNSDKSSELCQKVADGLNFLAISKDLGVYGDETSDDYEPNPFYKNMAGSLEINNKRNPFRHEYVILHKGKKFKRGTGSSIFHVSYSTNKRSGDESAAGGRYNLSLIEETGLCENVIDVHKSNAATLATDGERMGTEIYLGTSGNMELIAGTRRIFENPKDFDCLEFEDVFEGTNNKIGFFIPFYMVDMRFKDSDGNTDLEKAKQYAIDRRKDIKTKDKLNGEKMNFPIAPSEMWITREASILPKEEAKEVKKRLLSDYTYKNRTFVELIWDSTQPNGVKYKIIPEEEAIVMDTHQESQGSNEKKNKKGKSTECDIIVYEFPDVSKYNDLYKFIGVDPYVAEEREGGESLGSCFILKNPKYISEGISGDIVVAEITGKYSSRKDFNTKIEKLLAFYGNPQRSLMFEANRGDDIKEHFLKRNKEELLALSPVKFEDSKVLAKIRMSYGYTVGNDIAKLHNLNQLAEWLLEETTLYGETKKNIERIGSLGLLDEIIEYDWELDKAHKANYDRISALTGCIVARRENYNQLTKDEQPRKHIDLSAFGQKSIIKKLKSKNVWQTSSKMDSYQI